MDDAEIQKIEDGHVEWLRERAESQFLEADSVRVALEVLRRHPGLIVERTSASLGRLIDRARQDGDRDRLEHVEQRLRLLQEFSRAGKRADHPGHLGVSQVTTSVSSPEAGGQVSGRTDAEGDSASGLIDAQLKRNRLWSVVLVAAAVTNAAIVAAFATGFAGTIVAGLVVLGLIVLFVVAAMTRLHMTMSGDAGPAAPARAVQVTERVASWYGIPSPRVRLLDVEEPNAYALGRPGRATVTYTAGLLDLLDDDQLEGVAAHEIAHLVNNDSRVAALSRALLSWAVMVFRAARLVAVGIAMFGTGFAKVTKDDENDPVGGPLRLVFTVGFYVSAAMVFLFGLLLASVAWMVHLAIVRQREWMADATAAEVTGKPVCLADALAELARADTELPGAGRAVQSLCIAGAPRQGRWWDDLSDTHPGIEHRIAQLRGLASGERRGAGAGLIAPALAGAATLVIAGFVSLGVVTGSSRSTSQAAPGPDPTTSITLHTSDPAPSNTDVQPTPTPTPTAFGAGRVSVTQTLTGTSPTLTGTGAPRASLVLTPRESVTLSPTPVASRTAAPASSATSRAFKPTAPEITGVSSYQDGVLEYFRITYLDTDGDAEGFGFRGANGSGWAQETHPFSSPSYGRWSPGQVDYPFNLACGQPNQYETDVQAWIYDSAGLESHPVVIHLKCG